MHRLVGESMICHMRCISSGCANIHPQRYRSTRTPWSGCRHNKIRSQMKREPRLVEQRLQIHLIHQYAAPTWRHLACLPQALVGKAALGLWSCKDHKTIWGVVALEFSSPS